MTKASANQPSLYHVPIPEISESTYAGDRSNPNLRKFVEANRVQTQPLQPGGLPESQLVKRAGPLHDLHSYWSKKPYRAIETFVRFFTRPGELVLDPFCGCGSTLQAALMNGRRAIGIDVSPSATHIAANTLLQVDPSQFRATADSVIRDVATEVSGIYSAVVSGKRHWVSSLIHSESIRCIRCLRVFPLLKSGSTAPRETCPYCAEPFSTRSKNTQFAPGSVVAIEVRTDLQGRSGKLVWLDGYGAPAGFAAPDKELSSRADRIRSSLGYPVPQRLLDLGGRLTTSGSTTLGLLFDDRALLTLDLLKSRILKVNDPHMQKKLMLVFTSILMNCSKMYRFREGGGGGPIGAYYIPPSHRELNPLFALKDKVATAVASLDEIASWDDPRYAVSTQSSVALTMPSNTIDYVFTDPPYADTMPFGALNFIWDGWLSPEWGWMANEAIGDNWGKVMLGVFREMHRVLKPSGFCSVCYHDTSEGTWADLLDIMAEAGFKAVIGKDVLSIETTQRAYQQTVADKVVKRDLVVNFQRVEPRVFQVVADPSSSSELPFSELMTVLIRDTLADNPGLSKDRVYDLVTARLIEAGRLQPHDFEKALASVAFQHPDDPSRWFLREERAQLDPHELASEDEAAEMVAEFLRQWLQKHPEQEGMHFSDIFSYYVYSVTAKPRRDLADWLADYFYQTEAGTYRLPATEEERQLKAEGRAAGTSRLIRRYLAYLQQRVSVPERERPSDATLAEWIRHCKRAGSYGQGKILYEKGGLNLEALPEEAVVNVEEDYQVCVRMLARADSAAPAKKSRVSREKDQMGLGLS